MNPCLICASVEPHEHDMTRRWIGVDFDGTLSRDPYFRNSPYEVGEPIPAMIERVKKWIEAGYTVKLLTARMNPISHVGGPPRDIKRMEHILKAWCLEHIGHELECTMGKDGLMEVLWDDRAIQVVRDVGTLVNDYSRDSRVWTAVKPQVPGAYYIKWFEEEILVEIRRFRGKLFCNLNCRNTDTDIENDNWVVLEDLNRGLWKGPLS